MFDKYDKLTYTYIIEDKDTLYPLPEQTDWLGDFPYWDTPWWYREDVTTYDRGANDEKEYLDWQLEKEENNIDKINLKYFEEIEEEVIKLYNEMKDETKGEDEPKKGELISVDFGNKNKVPKSD